MILSVSLFHSGKLVAQMSFHEAGPEAYRQNLLEVSNIKIKRLKISNHVHINLLNKTVSEKQVKKGTEAKELTVQNIENRKHQEPTRLPAPDSVQKLRMAQLKRNIAVEHHRDLN